MHIAIISNSASFPWGMASTNRVKLLAKGLMHLGHSVYYIGVRGAHTNFSGKKKRSGICEEIEYNYPGLFAVRPKNWSLRRVDDITAKINSTRFIKNLAKSNKLDLIILYTRDYNTVSTWSAIAKKIGVKTVLELCEWPVTYLNKERKNAEIFCKKAPTMVDGVMPISGFITNELQNENWKANGIGKPIYEIPILVESEKFDNNRIDSKSEKPYIVYSGSSGYINIAAMIIKAMGKLKQSGCQIELKITGDLNGNKNYKLKELLEEYGIDDIVTFTGYLDEDVLIETMANARALLAPVPDDKQTQARFPTKIGFYLASGTPVITNPYGEVARYLTDKENVIFMDTFSSEELKSKIQYVLSDRESSNLIGARGREVALNNFDYKSALNGFDDFIQKLYK